MLSFAKKYWATLTGSVVVIGVLLVSGLFFGNATIDRMIETSVKQRSRTFADFLLDDPARLGSLLTGITRRPGLEEAIRTAAAFSEIEGFAIFDRNGVQTFSTRSQQHEWLLRNRPGGIVNGSRLAIADKMSQNDWQVVKNVGEPTPIVLMPLQQEGTLVAYAAIEVDVAAERAGFVWILRQAMTSLVLVFIVATGAPALFYFRRKRRMEEADERILFLHNHDPLTNLLNRRRMHEETDRILATSRATRERLALWFLDVDRLADINDGLGQASGDEVLRTIAQRLAEVADRSDLVSRIGSDDFAILQRHYAGEESTRSLAHRILAATNAPIQIGDQVVRPNVSLGVALMPEHGRTYAELIKHAEHAFLHQKNVRQKEYTVFQPAMDQETHRRRIIDQMLRSALECNGFELFYQPIVSGDGARLVGFEALIRMPDGDGAYIPPSEFIPIAEMRGHIKAIGTWVIGEAARQAAMWPDDLFISINLSAVQFRDGDLVDIVKAALDEAGIEGRRIEIEVVESLLLDHSDKVLEQLRALKKLGVSIDMDDFGTGYSSLGYLWRFPFDKLKIDQSFMTAFAEGQSGVPQILETIISLSHHLGLKVTAEGVESPEQAALLHTFGCDQLQGFYFGKPMPADKVAAELLARFFSPPPRSADLRKRALMKASA